MLMATEMFIIKYWLKKHAISMLHKLMKKYTYIKKNKNQSTNIFVMVIFRAFDFLV